MGGPGVRGARHGMWQGRVSDRVRAPAEEGEPVVERVVIDKTWVSRAVYEQLTRARVRIVLEALELALHSAKSERVKIESNLTIEHVMPQKWGEHWPLPGGVPSDEAKQLRDRLLHTFGNLTLVTGRMKPSMSNSAWATKKTALSEHGAFALNRKLCALEIWDEAAIKRRAVELLEECHRLVEEGMDIPAAMLRHHVELTDANAAIFDAANGFAGCIAGIHEVLRRQGLLEGIWCLDENEALSPGQAADIDRAIQAYPHLINDEFIQMNLHQWLS